VINSSRNPGLTPSGAGFPFPDQVEDKFHGNDTEESLFKELKYYQIFNLQFLPAGRQVRFAICH
jgi:hypothetical protein